MICKQVQTSHKKIMYCVILLPAKPCIFPSDHFRFGLWPYHTFTYGQKCIKTKNFLCAWFINTFLDLYWCFTVMMLFGSALFSLTYISKDDPNVELWLDNFTCASPWGWTWHFSQSSQSNSLSSILPYLYTNTREEIVWEMFSNQFYDELFFTACC